MTTIKINRLNAQAQHPVYGTEHAAGADLYSSNTKRITIQPGETVLIPTGLSMAIPEGHFGMVVPRSGLSLKTGFRVANTPGIIDSDYRGEIKVIGYNIAEDEFVVEPGTRIAQIIIVPFVHAKWEDVKQLDDTTRGEGGFGSTGTH